MQLLVIHGNCSKASQHAAKKTLLTFNRSYQLQAIKNSAIGRKESVTCGTDEVRDRIIVEEPQHGLSEVRLGLYIPSSDAVEEWCKYYMRQFGHVKIVSRTRRLQGGGQSNSTAMEKSLNIDLHCYFIHRMFSVSLINSFGHVSRTLKVYPVLENDAQIFKMSQVGDLDGLQGFLARGTVSPFVLDRQNMTLLHVC